MSLVFVAGSGGMLGSEVVERLGLVSEFRPWSPQIGPLAWNDQATVRGQLRAVAKGLVGAALDAGSEWVALWCAGRGVVGSPAPGLDEEAATFEHFLDSIRQVLGEAGSTGATGRIVLASSAGGVYGSGPGPFTEASSCCPISDYGRTKLRQEESLSAWARGVGVSTLVVRISNLYGPGQKLTKSQGLISHMARCVIQGRPIHVFVPLDTTRDYIFTADAAKALVGWTQRLSRESNGAGAARHVTKICASESETTIASLIGTLRRIARRQVRVVCGLHAAQAQQPPRMRLRSEVWNEIPTAQTGLLEGVSRLYRHLLSLHQAGELAFSSPQRPLTASQVPRTNPRA